MSRSEPIPRLNARGRHALVAMIGALRRCARGSVVVEAAIVIPMIAVSMGAGLDVARYMQVAARADHVALTLADMVSRADTIRDRATLDEQTLATDLGVYFALAEELAAPEPLAETGGVIIGSVTSAASGPRINWSRVHGGGLGGAALRGDALPPLPAGVTFIVVEAALPFDPVVVGAGGLLPMVGVEPMVRRIAVFRPRTGVLTALEPS
jgi:hypothetical protein